MALRDRRVFKEGRLSYADFVWFLISEEDKKTDTRYLYATIVGFQNESHHLDQSFCAPSIEYWFRCMDLDGDGVLSMYEMEYFYEEQCQKLESMAIEPLPFEDCLCQMLDLVKPRVEGQSSFTWPAQSSVFFFVFPPGLIDNLSTTAGVIPQK